MERLSRTRSLLGDDFITDAAHTRVIIFGMGGVGSWCAETLARTGIGHLTIVDFDEVAESNINRQLPALASTVGERKVEVLKRRFRDIAPNSEIVAVARKYDVETAGEFNLADYDYVVDAIDIIDDKALLIVNACAARTPLFSSMGAAMKLDPSRIEVAEFWKVKGCRLAAALRRKFKKTGIFPSRKFKCVFSQELLATDGEKGSLMQITASFGIRLASLIINDLYNKKEDIRKCQK